VSSIPPPTVRISPENETNFCNGSSVTLTASATGSNLTYQWQRTGQEVRGATASTLSVRSTGFYSVLVTENGLCSSVSPQVTVVQTTPTFPVIRQETSTLSSTTAETYQWLLNGNPIAGATSQTLQWNLGGNYQVRTTERGCPAESNVINIVVTAIEPVNSEASLLVFPNPGAQRVRIEYQPDTAVPQARLSIFQLSGVPLVQGVMQKDGAIFWQEIEVSDWPTGTFFVKIQDGKNEVVKRLVKQ
jgi:hypothetical protein